jgi:hypothetical protein
MIAIPYSEKDYMVIAPWWTAHGFPEVPITMLPKSGVVITDEGKPVAAAWLYMSNSNGVAMMEWVVTNPENTPKQSVSAIRCLVGAVREMAKNCGYSFILAAAKQPSLIRLFERGGFMKTDEGMTHLLMLTHHDAPPSPLD